MITNSDGKNQPAAFDIAADWLSFSLVHTTGGDGPVSKSDEVYTHIFHRWPELKITPHMAEYTRTPYKAAFKLAIGGFVYFAEALPHVLVEIQGKGCRALEDSGDFYAVATRAMGAAINITRFDIAVDFETDTDPEAFARMRGERWKAAGVMESETGKTAYVGAPKSARRARVYRYYPPHERAHLLRVEMVMKKPRSGDGLKAYLDVGPVEYAAMCGNAFGWSHPLWSFESDQKITSWTPERGHASTIRWLYKQVMPAIDRLARDGTLYPEHPFWETLRDVMPAPQGEKTPRHLTGGSKSFEPSLPKPKQDDFSDD